MQYFSGESQMYTHFDLMNSNLFDTDYADPETHEQIDIDGLLRSTLEAFEDSQDYVGERLQENYVTKSRRTRRPSYRVAKPEPARRRKGRIIITEHTNFESLPAEPWRVGAFVPSSIADSVNTTLDAEFRLLSKYKRMYRMNLSIPPSPRRRRESIDLIWRPLSVFKIYTTISPKEILDTNYLEMIPYQSCFGQINMRMKGAWKRNNSI
ncbi:hypothetical protein CLIB1423_15S01200 [[Candida] railenensis]|uniref:Uncharacterized protein n=1 Tax=[Candida] railenensis TaxID=45579 RepID=A0A9P0QSL2_9ASCO|nr:hypothetical protein CLIB1423_15S01200 [[Candida] railenensis]